MGLEGGFEPEFNVITGAEVAQVVNIDRHIKRGLIRKGRSQEQAGGMGAGRQSQDAKDLLD
jgi:hypothetical protein